MENRRMEDELLDLVSGGKLPEGWEKLADMYAPKFIKMYEDKVKTYDEALVVLQQYVTDPDDYAAIAEYMKKYFE